MQPHRRQPTRLPRPSDSPSKNTGMGCHVLLQCMKVKSESKVTQSSDFSKPRGLQPTRLPHPWDFQQEYWSEVHCLLRQSSLILEKQMGSLEPLEIYSGQCVHRSYPCGLLTLGTLGRSGTSQRHQRTRLAQGWIRAKLVSLLKNKMRTNIIVTIDHNIVSCVTESSPTLGAKAATSCFCFWSSRAQTLVLLFCHH